MMPEAARFQEEVYGRVRLKIKLTMLADALCKLPLPVSGSLLAIAFLEFHREH
jgi:hypothetical protein